MSGQRADYVHASTLDQNPDRQLEGVPSDWILTDHASGKDTRRPRLEALPAYVREGDTVVAYSIGRLARNLDDLRRLVNGIAGRGVRNERGRSRCRRSGSGSCGGA